LTDFFQIITIALAILGAILTSFTVYQKWRETRPKIRVDLDEEWIDDNGAAHHYYCVIARNIGIKPVTMKKFYIEESGYPHNTTKNDESIDGKQILSGQSIEISYRFPNDFNPIIDPYHYDNEPVEVRGVFIDQLGNVYRSKSFSIE